MLCFLRGWNAQLEVWRLIRSERLGGFAPVQVSDQAIYNRIERAAIPMQWLFEHVSAWLRARLAPWEDRRLAPWATAVYAADASTLDQLSRFLPWLRRRIARGIPACWQARSVPCLMSVSNNGCASITGRMLAITARRMF
jgi:hypothetical protein